MAAATKICKVCGKEYPYCKTANRENRFRWQDVACSPEHAATYFAQVAASRGEDYGETKVDTVTKASSVVEETLVTEVKKVRTRKSKPVEENE